MKWRKNSEQPLPKTIFLSMAPE